MSQKSEGLGLILPGFAPGALPKGLLSGSSVPSSWPFAGDVPTLIRPATLVALGAFFAAGFALGKMRR